MSIRFGLLTVCLFLAVVSLSAPHVLPGPQFQPPQQEETATLMPAVPTAAEIIEAVNNLRLQNGLNPLLVDEILMEVAASQANATSFGAAVVFTRNQPSVVPSPSAWTPGRPV